MKKPKTRLTALAAAGLLAMGLLTACGGGEESGGGGNEAAGGSAESCDMSFTIGIAAGWAEDVAVSHLWKHVLEEHGYDIKLNTLDVAPVFIGVAKGDLGLFFDTWLPTTHEDYWKKYGDKVVDLGVWYDKAPLTITVPAYMKIDSIDQLPSIGDKVNWTITGIDPGAGLTRVTQTKMMPAYNLDKYTLKTSSSTAMLAALKKAIDNKEPIVVTLWHPHWAYAQWDLKDLKDPKGAMGKPDSIHSIASNELADSCPQVIDAVKNWKMDDPTPASLEKTVLQEHKSDMDKGVDVWVKDHQDYVKKMWPSE